MDAGASKNPYNDPNAPVDDELIDDISASGRRHARAVDAFPEEPEVMVPEEKYQLTPMGRRVRIGQIFSLLRKYEVWHNLTPVRLRRLLEELGPMFVKMGQILANRSEILPQPYCDELRHLRTEVDPVPYSVSWTAWRRSTARSSVRSSMRWTPTRSAPPRSRRCTVPAW